MASEPTLRPHALHVTLRWRDPHWWQLDPAMGVEQRSQRRAMATMLATTFEQRFMNSGPDSEA
ncbi:MAG: hypothetical protein ACPGOT_05485 [Candidatus Poseidoniaceae archaeon]